MRFPAMADFVHNASMAHGLPIDPEPVVLLPVELVVSQ